MNKIKWWQFWKYDFYYKGKFVQAKQELYTLKKDLEVLKTKYEKLKKENDRLEHLLLPKKTSTPRSKKIC